MVLSYDDIERERLYRTTSSSCCAFGGDDVSFDDEFDRNIQTAKLIVALGRLVQEGEGF